MPRTWKRLEVSARIGRDPARSPLRRRTLGREPPAVTVLRFFEPWLGGTPKFPQPRATRHLPLLRAEGAVPP